MKFERFGEINAERINSLIENRVPEDLHLDYKQELKFARDEDKKELLADVCAFANSGGGIILFGISEERIGNSHTGIPATVAPINIENQDEIIRKIDQSVKDSIEPVIYGIRIGFIENTGVLAIFIPYSLNTPHMVKYAGTSKFYARGNACKYQMNVYQIRDMALNSHDLKKKALNFRSERIASIVAGQTPVPVIDSPKIVIHTIPFESFYNDLKLEVKNINHSTMLNFPLISESGNGTEINYDGFCNSTGSNNPGGFWAYTQVYRSGIVESVDTTMLSPHEGQKFLHQDYENQVLKFIAKLQSSLQGIGVNGPAFLFVTLLGVKDYWLKPPSNRMLGTKKFINNVIALPEIYVDEVTTFIPDQVFKRAFDIVWNVAGQGSSLNYNSNGNWTGGNYRP
ncbi:MAG: ATP-binding protein [Pseudomonadota bacterium]